MTLWERMPAPDPGVLQEQSRGCEQFRQIFMLLKIFLKVSSLSVHMALETDFSPMICLH